MSSIPKINNIGKVNFAKFQSNATTTNSMISMKDYEEFREYMFYKEVQRRAMAYAAEPVMTYSRDDVMKEYDITEEDLKEVEDEVEFDYD